MIEFKREIVGEVAVITAVKSGQPGLAGIAELKQIINRLIAGGSRRFHVNLEALDFLESSGMGVMIGCVRLVAEREGALVFTGLNANVLAALKACNLTKIIAFRKTAEEGLEAAGKTPLKREHLDKMTMSNPAIPSPEMRQPRSSEAVPTFATARSSSTSIPRLNKAVAAAQPPEALKPVLTQTNGAAAVAEIPAVSVAASADDDWSHALALFSQVRTLCERHSVAFTVDSTFRETFATLAEKHNVPK
ncbi:MAG: STAS domain-containing protein [Candidatus Sumerlaeota bacterium]